MSLPASLRWLRRAMTLILIVFGLFVVVVWFLTGTFAGWLVVRHVRRLGPGITRRQGWGVSTSWGCGAIIAALMTILVLVLLARLFNL